MTAAVPAPVQNELDLDSMIFDEDVKRGRADSDIPACF